MHVGEWAGYQIYQRLHRFLEEHMVLLVYE